MEEGPPACARSAAWPFPGKGGIAELMGARARTRRVRAERANARSQGFVAKPGTLPDGTQDILNWDVVIPGKDGTIWEHARIPMSMCARRRAACVARAR